MKKELFDNAQSILYTINRIEDSIKQINKTTELGTLIHALFSVDGDMYNKMYEPLKKELLDRLNQELEDAKQQFENL